MSADTYSWDSRIAFVVRYMYGKLQIIQTTHEHPLLHLHKSLRYLLKKLTRAYKFSTSFFPPQPPAAQK